MKKLALSIVVAVLMCSGAYALDVTKPTTDPYLVILRDGSDNQRGVTFVVKRITDRSYVGDILDADGHCIAKNRRFFFTDSITEQLSDGEKGLVSGTDPDDRWKVSEIRTWLDSKQTRDEDGKTVADDLYGYKAGDSKAALLSKIDPVEAQ